MKALDLIRSLGGVFLIALGAVLAAVVARFTWNWVFIPVFVVLETVAFYLYYRAVFRK